jgi:hypothetical protein
MHRSVVTSQIDHKAVQNFLSQPMAFVHLENIEKIAWVLPVHRSKKFAAKEFKV